MSVFYKSAEKAPCTLACPAGIDIPLYVRHLARGEYNKALAVIRERVPFPRVLGYVCTHPCEAECRSSLIDGATAIRALKRFVVDNAKPIEVEPVAKKRTGKKVAVIGAGPAGLTVAYYLSRLGHWVTVFEETSQPGGMMRAGIPDYHLPKGILDAEIADILDTGIELRLNTRVEDISNLLEQYDAVFVATGAHEGTKLPIPGADLDGVLIGLSFLKDINQGKEVKIGNKVLVLGGGGVAIDAARVARRLGAEVSLACLESRQTMPALAEDIEAAEEEAITIYPSRTFMRIVERDGHAGGVECLNLEWMKFDQEGGLHLRPIAGSSHLLEANTVIFATGQRVDPSLISDVTDIEISRGCTIVAEPSTMQTGHPCVFAGGDVVSGPAAIIDAIAAGRKAATAIDRYLGGQGDITERLAPPEGEVEPFVPDLTHTRVAIPSLPPEERIGSFAGVEQALTEEAGIAEPKRCLRCDIPIVVDSDKCVGCLSCELICSLAKAGRFSRSASHIHVDRVRGGAEYKISFDEGCDTCGLCVRYCTHNTLTREKRGE